MTYRLTVDMGDGYVAVVTPKALHMTEEDTIRMFHNPQTYADHVIARNKIVDAFNSLANAKPKGSC